MPVMGPILMYHYLGEPPPRGERHRGLWVHPEEFRGQLAALGRMGLRTVTSRGYLAGERGVWLTFDDGRRDNHDEGLGVLLEAGYRATFFVVVEETLAEKPGAMTPGMVRELVAAGMEIGSHTLTHPRLVRCTPAELEREVRGSREKLEDLLGQEVGAFCYPYGNFDERVMEAVRAAGYACACSTIRGNRNGEGDRWRLRRAMVQPGRTGWRFRYLMGPAYHWLHTWKNRRRWKARRRAK